MHTTSCVAMGLLIAVNWSRWPGSAWIREGSSVGEFGEARPMSGVFRFWVTGVTFSRATVASERLQAGERQSRGLLRKGMEGCHCGDAGQRLTRETL